MRASRFHRLLAFALVAIPALPHPLAAAETPDPAPAFHARRLGEAKSPPATLDQVAWLAGHWVGEGLGGVSEELWSPPAGGAMMGTYRLLKDGAPVFYEFLLLAEENGTLILKLKHFNPDLTGWEEKADFVDFPLVAIEADAVHFDGLTYERQPDGSLRVYLLLRNRETGAVREELFTMRRAG
jgi:hypothetical protein